jgi:hypothetical protein
VVVGEDRLADPGLGSRCRATGAQHRRCRVDRIRRVIHTERGAGIGINRILAERRGLELHRTLGPGEIRAPVHTRRTRAAVVALHRADPRQHTPRQARAGLRRVQVQRQIRRRDIRQRHRRRAARQAGTGRVRLGGRADQKQQRERHDNNDSGASGAPLEHGQPVLNTPVPPALTSWPRTPRHRCEPPSHHTAYLAGQRQILGSGSSGAY